MRIARHAFRTTARGLWLPLCGALVLCHTSLLLVPSDSRAGAPHTAGQWLHVPALLLVAAALGAALESWPLFSRARPGAGWVQRVRSRWLHGCGAAALGTGLALGVALVVAAVAFAALLAVRGIGLEEVRERLTAAAEQDRPYLDSRTQVLRFRVGGSRAASSLHLHPTGVYAGPDAAIARVRVLADGAPLHEGSLENSGERIELRITPPRVVHEIEIRGERPARMALRLTADHVEILAAATRSSLWNCVFALLSYLAPALLALAVMVLGHAWLALPVNFAAGFVACLLATLLGLTPNAAAITAFARGRWVPGELAGLGPLLGCGWVVAVSGGLLAIAWLATAAAAGRRTLRVRASETFRSGSARPRDFHRGRG